MLYYAIRYYTIHDNPLIRQAGFFLMCSSFDFYVCLKINFHIFHILIFFDKFRPFTEGNLNFVWTLQLELVGDRVFLRKLTYIFELFIKKTRLRGVTTLNGVRGNELLLWCYQHWMELPDATFVASGSGTPRKSMNFSSDPLKFFNEFRNVNHFSGKKASRRKIH